MKGMVTNMKRITALLLLSALLLTLFSGCAKNQDAEPTVSSTEAPSEAAEFIEPDSETLKLYHYSITETAADDPLMQATVAVDTNDNPCLGNADLQIYYWIEFYNFMNSYGSYAAYFGLDYTKPLGEQDSMSEGMTWEQYFLLSALEHFRENYALAQAAYADGYTLSEEDEKMVNDVTDPDSDFAKEYQGNGYDSADAYLRASFGDGVTTENYQNYLRLYYAAYDYYTKQREAVADTFSAEEVEAYFDENAQPAYGEGDDATEAGKYAGTPKVTNVSVRHILIQPDGEKDATTQDWSEEAWAAAEEKVNEVYARWQENPTEENFALIANEESADGDGTTGGLYEDFAPGSMTQNFNDWCFDEARNEGDTGIVRTEYGYHIIYFLGHTETQAWYNTALNDMVSEKMTDVMEQALADYPVRFDYAHMRVFDLISANAEEEATEGETQDESTTELPEASE